MDNPIEVLQHEHDLQSDAIEGHDSDAAGEDRKNIPKVLEGGEETNFEKCHSAESETPCYSRR